MRGTFSSSNRNRCKIFSLFFFVFGKITLPKTTRPLRSFHRMYYGMYYSGMGGSSSDLYLMLRMGDSLPSTCPDVSTHYFYDETFCSSDLDYNIGFTSSATECWNMCESQYGWSLVAIDWVNYGNSDGECYCQDACDCLVAGEGRQRIVSNKFSTPSASLLTFIFLFRLF